MKLLVTTQAVDQNHPILGFFVGWIHEFAKHFDEVHVICLQKGTYDLPANVFVYSLGKETGENRLKYLWRFYNHFWHVFFHVRVDYVFFHMGAIYNILAAPFFWLRHFYHTKFYWWKTHGVINRTGKLARFFVDEIYTAGDQSYSIIGTKVNVVGHAIDTDVFNMQNRTPQARRVLAVGRITPIKELETTLRIIAKVNEYGVKLDLRLIGPTDNEPYSAKLLLLIAELGLGQQVTFTGSMNQRELQKEYSNAYILIHPAYRAGFDKVVLEAMASGVIPLTSTPSFESILKPFGLFVPANDVNTYADRIVKIFKHDDEQLSQKLRQIVITKHSIHTLSKRIFNL